MGSSLELYRYLHVFIIKPQVGPQEPHNKPASTSDLQNTLANTLAGRDALASVFVVKRPGPIMVSYPMIYFVPFLCFLGVGSHFVAHTDLTFMALQCYHPGVPCHV